MCNGSARVHNETYLERVTSKPSVESMKIPFSCIDAARAKILCLRHGPCCEQSESMLWENESAISGEIMGIIRVTSHNPLECWRIEPQKYTCSLQIKTWWACWKWGRPGPRSCQGSEQGYNSSCAFAVGILLIEKCTSNVRSMSKFLARAHSMTFAKLICRHTSTALHREKIKKELFYASCKLPASRH